ncbi:hypothetical protein QTP88_027128 [Uroleucon formosanum]
MASADSKLYDDDSYDDDQMMTVIKTKATTMIIKKNILCKRIYVWAGGFELGAFVIKTYGTPLGHNRPLGSPDFFKSGTNALPAYQQLKSALAFEARQKFPVWNHG